ncbi:uncharacterized protein LOC135490828 isoform X2 [Lineus longissimus]|uniref:uncharacterized protein LOC135490828 isoform X2 n=1 Tax=Lineus longissimus TaxID=88925 RepID=UPI00315CD3EE
MEVVYFLLSCCLLRPIVAGDVSILPNSPTNVTVEFVNLSDPLLAKVTWNASPGEVDFYRMTIQKKGTDFLQVRNTRRGTELFTFLELEETYEIRVAANNGGKFSENANLTVETTTLFDPTATVKNITITNITLTSVQVSWEPPRGKVKYYTLEYSETRTDTARLRQSFAPHMPSAGTRVTLTLHNLKLATSYSLTVRPYFVEGRGMESEISFRSARPPMSKLPNSPTNVTVEFVNLSDPLLAKVTWNASPGEVDFYRMTIQRKGTDFLQVRNTRRGTELFTFLELEETYEIRVAANSGGKFSENASLTVETPALFDPTATVKNLTVTNITLTSVQVSWEPPRGKVKYYTLEYSETRPDTERLGQSFAPHMLTVTLVTLTLYNLKLATSYSLTVRPYFVEGSGMESEISFKTARPEAVDLVKDCLSTENCWVEYNFTAPSTWNDCAGGAKYVKKNHYDTGLFLGVELCTATEYKLFLSNNFTSEYKHIADVGGHGADHCEMMAAPGVVQESDMWASYQDIFTSPMIKGFYRYNVGDNPSYADIGARPVSTSKLYPKSYKCGIAVPGSVRVVRYDGSSDSDLVTFTEPTPGGALSDANDSVKDCLSTEDCWLEYDFTAPSTWNDCAGGTKYVKKNHYSVGKFLGVELCTPTKYKLFLSDDFNSEYSHIGDRSGHGGDHCEMMAAPGVIPKNDMWASDEGLFDSPNIKGYFRYNWEDTPTYGDIGEKPIWTGRFYPKSYKCGIAVPGSVRVVKYDVSPDSGLISPTAGATTPEIEPPEALTSCDMQKVDNALMREVSMYVIQSSSEDHCSDKCRDITMCDGATFIKGTNDCLIHLRRGFILPPRSRDSCCTTYKKDCPLIKRPATRPNEQILCALDRSTRKPSEKYAYRVLRLTNNFDRGEYSCRTDELCAGLSFKASDGNLVDYTFYYNNAPEPGVTFSNSSFVKNCQTGGPTCRKLKAVFGKTLKDISPYRRKTAVRTKAECVASCEGDRVGCSAATFRWKNKECWLYRFHEEDYDYQLEPVRLSDGKVMTWIKDPTLCHPGRRI